MSFYNEWAIVSVQWLEKKVASSASKAGAATVKTLCKQTLPVKNYVIMKAFVFPVGGGGLLQQMGPCLCPASGSECTKRSFQDRSVTPKQLQTNTSCTFLCRHAIVSYICFVYVMHDIMSIAVLLSSYTLEKTWLPGCILSFDPV